MQPEADLYSITVTINSSTRNLKDRVPVKHMQLLERSRKDAPYSHR